MGSRARPSGGSEVAKRDGGENREEKREGSPTMGTPSRFFNFVGKLCSQKWRCGGEGEDEVFISAPSHVVKDKSGTPVKARSGKERGVADEALTLPLEMTDPPTQLDRINMMGGSSKVGLVLGKPVDARGSKPIHSSVPLV